MGHGAQTNRRALTEIVEDCMKQVNAMTRLVSALREANNTLAQRTSTDVADLKSRLDRVEQHDTLTRELAHAAHRRVSGVRDECLRSMTALSLWARVRWLVFGTLPPLAGERAILALTLSGDTAKASNDWQTITTEAAQEVATKSAPAREFAAAMRPSNSMSAGMAPRPLP
jgi:hypothetical protein